MSSSWPFKLAIIPAKSFARLKLQVTDTGEVIVTAPPGIPKFLIEKFVNNHLDWIDKARKKANTKIQPIKPDQVMIFGNWLVAKPGNAKLPGWHARDGHLYYTAVGEIRNEISLLETKIYKSLNLYLQGLATKYIVPRTHQLAQKMNTTFGRISLRAQKTRWGSCSSQGNLNFNWHLAHFPTPVIDYVIIHELAHRTHMNHSASFWALVAKYDPNYQQHRNWLKKNGITFS